MRTIFNLFLGLSILVHGLLKGRKTAIQCGGTLLAFAAGELLYFY